MLGSLSSGDLTYKLGGGLTLLSARPVVTPLATERHHPLAST